MLPHDCALQCFERVLFALFNGTRLLLLQHRIRMQKLIMRAKCSIGKEMDLTVGIQVTCRIVLAHGTFSFMASRTEEEDFSCCRTE